MARIGQYAENAFFGKPCGLMDQTASAVGGMLVRQSGYLSYMYLQNIIPTGAVDRQEMGVALALCAHYLGERGAYRVHGGGFAGTVQAFVPLELLDGFRAGIDKALGSGACHVLSIRPQGGVEMTAD